MSRSRRLTAPIAAVLGLALALTGCVPQPRDQRSTPTLESVTPELEPFYHQVLRWQDCGADMQCATVTAPMDWSNPGNASIELAIVRQPATGSERLGSLLVNPGGPGASGRDLVLESVDFAVSNRLQQRYDVVGFDPRGVGASSAVSCYDDPAALDEYLYGLSPAPFASDAWIADLRTSAAAFAQGCLEHTGPLLEFVDTESAARDLDLLRAVLGDAKLNYLGYSYGTLLGATYAELYPQNTGRLVLDGALDPATSGFDVSATQAEGFESAMRAYLADCLDGLDCPFRGTVDAAMRQVAALLDRLDASPLRHSDGRLLGSSAMFTAIILPLYSVSSWHFLDDLFTEVFAGGTDTAFFLADNYNERNPDGSYATNQTEAFIAINCLDYADDTSTATLRAEAALLAERAPVFGPRMSYGVTCDGWPFPSTRDRVPIAADGSSDILVVGTTNDPATPYRWAQNLAAQLRNGHLVTYNGEGHTAYNKSNRCVDDTVDDYFIDGTVPAADPDC